MGVQITVELDRENVRARIKAASERATNAAATQALKDSNYYCKQDSEMLIKSSILASQPEKGLLVWDTPYAKKQYYTGEPSHDVNPHASKMWAHTARAQHGEDWRKIAQTEINKEV